MTTKRSNKWASGLRPTSQKGINPKEEHGIAKVPLGYVPPTLEVLAALGMKEGAIKYGPYNYRKIPVQMLTYLEACKRHLDALIDGEDFDPDTGYPHISMCLSCLAIVGDGWVTGTIIDNRPLPGVAGDLIKMYNLKLGEPEKTPGERMQMMMSFISNQRRKLHPQDEGKTIPVFLGEDVTIQFGPEGTKIKRTRRNGTGGTKNISRSGNSRKLSRSTGTLKRSRRA